MSSGANRSSLHLNLFDGVVDAMLRIVSSPMRARFRIAFRGALVEERVHRTNIQRMPPRLDNQVNDVAVSRRSAIRDRPGRPASDAFFNPERWNRNWFPFRAAAFFTRRTNERRIDRVHWKYRRGGNCSRSLAAAIRSHRAAPSINTAAACPNVDGASSLPVRPVDVHRRQDAGARWICWSRRAKRF
jgi:hypothetical protein